MSFTDHARAARDAAFAHLGQWVALRPDGPNRAEVRAMVAAQSVAETMGAIQLVQNGRFMRFRAEDAPPRGTLLALLAGPAGAETERRRTSGEPRFADGRRLVVETDTVPA